MRVCTFVLLLPANFKLAAAAIVAASSSFSEHHRSLVSRSASKASRHRSATAISKTDITPVLTALDPAVAVESETQLSVNANSGSRSETPHNTSRGDDVITNHVGVESGNSQGSSDSSTGVVRLEPYIAKYNYAGSTDIELPLKKGEMVSVLEKASSGWWQGVCAGRVGWFPASYVKPAPLREKEEGGRREEGSGLLRMEESMKSETVDATGERERAEIV